jgi:arylformamidase
MRWIDLSHNIDEEMPVYPGTFPPSIKVTNTIEQDGFTESEIQIYNHVGTHIDMPAHVIHNGKNLNDFDITYFQAKALCVSIDSIHVKELEKVILTQGIESLLIKTGFDVPIGILKNILFIILK